MDYILYLSFIAFESASNKHFLAFSLCPDMVQLRASPVLYAECGTKVILKCEVSSPHGLSVKHMGWSLNGGSLCSVKDDLLDPHPPRLRGFRCMYSHGHLSLVLHDVQPQHGGNSTYMCKLRSNKGAPHATTRVEFKGQSAYLRLTLSWNKTNRSW